MVSHRFPPDAVAGVERYTEALAATLRRGGDEVAVLARRPAPGPARTEAEELADGTRVFRLAGGGVDRERFLRHAPAAERAFRDALARERPDVVHLNHLIDLSPRLPLLAREGGAAVVLTLHDFWFACPRIILQRPDGSPCDGPDGGRACATACFGEGRGSSERWGLRALYFRRLLATADRVLCPSEYVARWFRAWGGAADRTVAVPNGIWIEGEEPEDSPLAARRARRRAERRDRGARPLVLAVLGSVVPHKGHHVILEAARDAGVAELEVHAHGPVGDAGYARRLRDEAAGIAGLRLRLFGAYEPDELPLLLEGVDCVVVPSTWPETFCLVAREALALDLPVLATRLGALGDAVEEGVNGLTFPHDRPEALAGLLRRLADEEGLLERLRAGARRTAPTTMTEHARRVRAEYERALEAPDRASRPSEAERAELEVLSELLEARGFGAPALEGVA